ncbi:SH3 domain-containing protein [uncultured Ruegeria sp.]|uniref:SH3 domain-containing protein n=1 Tax=uncultured Ruegeria sp. TaxID=259304 RepID=UPI00262996D6|nr:SH3 domain-containing protein [uncultured Ruegeria sp.]
MKALPLALALLLCGPAFAQRQSFPPVDQAERDPDLLAFRADLLAKITAQDTESVVAAACPGIYLSHDSKGGPDEFRLNLTVPPEVLGEEFKDEVDELREAYWSNLQNTLSQPGYFDDQGEFWMPAHWQIALPASLDPFTAYFVAAERVTLRQTPSRSGAIVGLISHEVVIVPDYQPDETYQKVRLTDGTTGHMHSDFLTSMVGYRAALVKSDTGDWQLCTFVTGD